MTTKKKFLTLVIVLGILLIPLAIASSPNKDIDKIKEKHEKDIFSIEGVNAIYADKDANEIVVLVEDEKTKEKIPKDLEGVKVKSTNIGKKIRAFKTVLQPLLTYSRTGVNIPIFGGISLGSAAIQCSSGTLGIVTKNNYILSNAHVLAMDNNANFVSIGTATWQPGGYDTNCGSDNYNKVGKLSKYMKITFNNRYSNNYADAAISTINSGIGNSPGMELNSSNDGFYTVSGTTDVSYGDDVRKSGRTTGVTYGKVVSSSATVKVWYTNYKWALFRNQIVVCKELACTTDGGFSQPGDSGSMVDKNGQWAGLLFAGGGPYTIVSKASYIKNGLVVDI